MNAKTICSWNKTEVNVFMVYQSVIISKKIIELLVNTEKYTIGYLIQYRKRNDNMKVNLKQQQRIQIEKYSIKVYKS